MSSADGTGDTVRSQEELLDIIDFFKKSLASEFQKDIPLFAFEDCMLAMAKERLHGYIENRLGHLKNCDFFRLLSLYVDLCGEERKKEDEETKKIGKTKVSAKT